jgi:hypothetical protein
VIEVVVRIVGAGVVAHPSIVPGVDVGDIGMAFFVDGNEVRSPGKGFLGRGWRGRARLGGSGTASGDVPTAHRRGLLTLRESSQAY